MLNAGFQYLEQRDANDTITKDGVVGKNSPFATSDNSGIYDIIAEDLRWLKENIDSITDDDTLNSIKQSVESMYNDMKTNPNFGSTAATAQAQEALKQAKAAADSASQAKVYSDKAIAVSTTISEIQDYLKQIDALQKQTSDNATTATNKANSASTSATSAKTSETNAKTSEINALSSATSSATSARSSSDSMNMSKAWAISTTSPDNAVDSNSSTGKTQSSRTWALYSKDRAAAAKASEDNAKASAASASTNAAKMQDVINNAVTTLQQALNGENKAYMCTDDISYPIAQIDDNGTIYPMDIVVVSEGEPANGTEVWIDI